MTIEIDEVMTLMNAFHDVTMIQKGTAVEQAACFLHPDAALIYVPHGDDLSLQANYEIHQQLTDERHVPLEPWEITQLSDNPDRARAVGAVYWEGRPLGEADQPIKVVVGEDWIVQRDRSGALKIVLYINPYHHFLPDSAQIALG
jgi:hypothetical protein